MFRVIAGEGRVEAEKAVKRLLGANYEVFEGENLREDDLPSIFRGNSLFQTGKRQILLKNLSENAAVWEKILDYRDTEHDVVIWEGKIDKRSAGYKRLKAEGVEIEEYSGQKPPDMRAVFQVFEVAWRDGEEAVRLLEKIEAEQDPYMFFGLMVAQALKRFEARSGEKERRVLKMMAETDMQMKTTSIEPWMLVKSFLLRIAQ